jgi:rod shape-determining protein MreC
VHDKQIRRRRAVLALLVVVSLILLTAYFGESPNSPLHSVQRGVGDVLSPVQDGASRVLSPVRDIAGWFSRTINASSENTQLKKQVARDNKLIAQYQYDAIQNRQLSNLVHLDRTNNIDSYNPVSASVIASNPSVWYDQITVNAGAGDGVSLNDAVIAGASSGAGAGGLVGDVTTVGSDYSVVTLVTAPKFAVGALVEEGGAHGDSGVLQPAVGEQGSLLLQYLPPHAQINVGDEVVTSGFSDPHNQLVRSFAPPDIPIGQVTNANQNTLINNQEVTVAPAVDLRHLSVVQILTRNPSHTVSASIR